MNSKVRPTIQIPEVSKKKRSFSYLSELKEELRKVAWTTKAELVFCTKVVVYSTFLFGLGIYLIDLFIKGILNGIGFFMHLIFG